LLTSKLDAWNKIKKAPMLLHQGFVVAGAGLFNDPEKGGLTTKPLSHFVRQCLLFFHSRFANAFAAVLKK